MTGPAARPLAENLVFWRSLAAGIAALPAPEPTGQAALLPPVLDWLAGVLIPGCAVQLGVGDGAGYFALCEAMGRTADGGTPARIYGFDPWPQAGGRVPTALRSLNETHFRQFSRLIVTDPAAAADFFEPAAVDLLILGAGLPESDLAALLAQWLPLMSARGVILLCELPTADADPAAPLAAGFPRLDIGHADTGPTLLLVGRDPVPLLAEIATAAADAPERLALARHVSVIAAMTHVPATVAALAHDKAALEQALAQLRAEADAAAAEHAAEATGALQTADLATRLAACEAELAQNATTTAALRQDLAARAAELAQATADITGLTGQADAYRRDAESLREAQDAQARTLELARTELAAARQMTGKVEAEASRLRQEKVALDRRLDLRQAEMEAILRISETLRADLDRSRAEHAAAVSDARVRDGMLAELRQAQQKLLARHEAQTTRSAAAERQIEALRQQAEQSRRELATLHSSTSWRITTPLRRFRSAFRR